MGAFASTFEGCTSVRSIDLQGLVTSEKGAPADTNYRQMFKDCWNLNRIIWPQRKAVIQDNTGYFDNMYYNCRSLKTIDFDWLDAHGSVDSMSQIFYGCTSVEEIDLTGLAWMWEGCSISRAFYNCINLKSIYVQEGFIKANQGAASEYGSFVTSATGGNSQTFSNCYRLRGVNALKSSEAAYETAAVPADGSHFGFGDSGYLSIRQVGWTVKDLIPVV